MDIKLIALDLDGTLLNDDHMTISKRNIAALNSANSKGVNIVITSGRSLAQCKNIIFQLPFIKYGIFSNGAYTVNLKSNKVVNRILIVKNDVLDIINILKQHKVFVMAFNEGKVYTQRGLKLKNPLIPKIFLEHLERNCVQVDDLYDFMSLRNMEKIDITGIDDKRQSKIEADIKKVKNIVITSSIPHNIELNAKNATKGVALEFLLEYLNINEENAMAFGDNGNDLSMLSLAKFSVAMENGISEAKQVAKIIAPPNSKDGVATVIENYLLS